MGCFDTYGKHMVQIKAGQCLMHEYKVGDKTNLSDGIYVGYEGVIVIYKGKMVDESENLTDKWGNTILCSEIISPRNPIYRAYRVKKSKCRERF